jgi:hypothetical protein
MSVIVRPYRRGGWEVDVTIRLPDGSRLRERSKAPVSSKSAAHRWGEDRERHLLQRGPEQRRKEAPTLAEFAPRFLEGYAVANRLKPSGIVSKESIIRVHLIPLLGSKKLDAITNEHVQRLKRQLVDHAAKTANNVLSAERDAEESRRVGPDGAHAMHRPSTADSEAVRRVLRLRRVRAVGGRDERWHCATDRPAGGAKLDCAAAR